MYQAKSLQMEWCLSCHRAPQKELRPREEVFSMAYAKPAGDRPVRFDGQTYTDQIALGNALIKKYNVRSPQDITSCNTCHQ
jgi:hypothetical protein